MTKKTVPAGLYLVLDPSINELLLLPKLQAALAGGVSIVQVWNNWPAFFTLEAKRKLVHTICQVAAAYNVPVLINQEWELLQQTALNGVHFDTIPKNYAAIKATIKRDFICGITCSNNLEVVEWAEQNQFDYVSFCAMFPSSSAGSCEIVNPETVRQARALTSMPFFLSGGITVVNLTTLNELDFAGVAVISGILSADFPEEAACAYTYTLKNLTP